MIDVAQLRHRLRDRRRRQRQKLLSRLREPSALGYTSDLLDVAARAQALIWTELEHWLHEHEREQARHDSVGDDLAALFRRLRTKTAEVVAGVAPGVARRMVRETAESNRTAMNAQLKQVIKVDPFVGNKGLESVMLERVRDNVELIESIPEQLLTEVEAVVRPRVVSGIRSEEIMKRVQERFEVSDSRAKLIARDQVGKFNAQVAQERQQALGIDSYVWSTSKDERVRHDHAILEGRVFLYADPPVVDVRTGRRANPGEDFQCRCQALARVSSLLDALGIPDVADDDTDAAE